MDSRRTHRDSGELEVNPHPRPGSRSKRPEWVGESPWDVWRLWETVDKESPEDHWLWTGSVDTKGYGYFVYAGRKRRAHRLVYELVHGQDSAGDGDLDHLCRVPLCVNPSHLEPVTHKENLLRGSGVAAVNADKTCCPKGHPYDEQNTLYGKRAYGVSRVCRSCTYARNLRRYYRSKYGPEHPKAQI